MYVRVVAVIVSIASLGATAVWAQDSVDATLIRGPDIALPQIGAFVGGSRGALIGVSGSYPIGDTWGIYTQISRTLHDSPATWRFDLGVDRQTEAYSNFVQPYMGLGTRLAYGHEEEDAWHVGVILKLGVAFLLSSALRPFAETTVGALTGGPDLTFAFGVAYVFPRRM